MRILNISLNCTFTYGLGYQENLLPEYQKKLGHDVTLITSDLMRDADGNVVVVEPGESILENGVRLVRIHTPSFFSRIGYYPQIGKLIEKYKPDLIFAHNLCTMIPAQAIKYKKKHPNVILISDNHQDAGNGGRPGIITKLTYQRYKLHWKSWIKHFYKIYGTTAWRKDYAHEKYGIPHDKLDTLLMGVDTDRLPEDFKKVRADVRSKLNIPESSFVFVNGGKLHKEKLIVETLSAFVKMGRPDAHIILFGKLFDDVQEEVLEFVNANDNIHYLGFIAGNDVKKYLIASDFGVFPGRHSVIWEEAIGCGLPCIFGKYPGSNHMDICGNAFLFDDPQEEDILAIMKKTVEDEEYYRTLKGNAIKASDSLSYYTIAKKSLEGCDK